jgi:hypothetical protein
MMAGLKEVKTRLCIRMHNDVHIKRDDWTDILINKFNLDRCGEIIGTLNNSGNVMREQLDPIVKEWPVYKDIYDSLAFDKDGRIGSYFLSAFFIASQTYILRELSSLVFEVNEEKMDKEDCLITIMANLFNIKIVSWNNMYDFVCSIAKPGDFEKIPETNVIKTKEFGEEFLSKPEFKEVE